MKFFILSLISALSLTLAFMPVNFVYFIYVSLIPFILMNTSLPAKKAFLYSMLSGMFFYAIRFYWMMSVLYEFNGFKFFYVYLLVIVLTSIFLGILGLFISILREKKYVGLYIGSILVIIEFLRGNLPIISFTWGRFSDVLYNQPLILKLASIGGEWLLLYFIVIVNYFILFLARKKNIISFILIALILLLLYLPNKIYLQFQQVKFGKPKIAIIQPNINPWKKYYENTDDEIYKLIEESIKKKANYIILPEATFMYENPAKNIKIEKYSRFATLIVGAAYFKDNKFYNSDFIIRNGKADEYRKHHLVPFVEYVPFRQVFSKVAGVPSGDTVAGTSLKIFGNKNKFGIEICFESIFEKIARQYAVNGANFIVVSTNDGWFGNTFAVQEHFRKLNIIAAETGMNFIQSANTGISGFIDYRGITIIHSQKNTRTILYINPNLKSEITFYDRSGYWWILFLLLPVVIIEIKLYIQKNFKHY